MSHEWCRELYFHSSVPCPSNSVHNLQRFHFDNPQSPRALTTKSTSAAISTPAARPTIGDSSRSSCYTTSSNTMTAEEDSGDGGDGEYTSTTAMDSPGDSAEAEAAAAVAAVTTTKLMIMLKMANDEAFLATKKQRQLRNQAAHSDSRAASPPHGEEDNGDDREAFQRQPDIPKPCHYDVGRRGKASGRASELFYWHPLSKSFSSL